jgi:hypothetical protein
MYLQTYVNALTQPSSGAMPLRQMMRAWIIAAAFDEHNRRLSLKRPQSSEKET